MCRRTLLRLRLRMRLCEIWFGGQVLIIAAKEKYLTVHVCGWFSMKCNWHTPTHVRGNGMYATHFEQLNIGIFVCGRSETLPTRPLVQPQLAGNAIRCQRVLHQRPMFPSTREDLGGGPGQESRCTSWDSRPRLGGEMDEMGRSGRKPDLHRDPLTFAVRSKANSSALAG